MAVLTSLIDPEHQSARAAAASIRALVADLRARTATARSQRVQERIDRLIDADAAFLELSPPVRGLDGAGAPGAGIVTGIGWVGGAACMIVADDATAGSSAIDALTLRKQQRAQQIAAADRLPCIYLVDGGAADGSSPPGAGAGADGAGLAALLGGQAGMSAAGIPQVVALLGADDEDGQGRVGPGDETVALAGRAHPAVDYVARDEPHALAICREIVAALGRRPGTLPWARLPSRPPAVATPDADDPSASQQDPTGIYAVAGAAGRSGHDVREVLARLLDGSELHELDGHGGTAVTCGFGHLDGVPLGVLAVTGALDGQSVRKGVRFVAMAERRSVPILILEAGAGGDGGELAAALARASAPIFGLLVTERDGALLADGALTTRGTWRWPSSTDAQTADSLGRSWHDGVIDPAQTRDVLALAISAALPAG